MAVARLTSTARRAAILDAAVQLFSEKGFRGVTTRELAAAVGVTEPVLYQHFETKRELYRALIEERAVAGERAIARDLPKEFESIGDDRKFLISLVNGIIQWHMSDPAYVRLLMFSALEQHELSEFFYENYSKAFFDEVIQYFEKRMAAGAFRQIDPRIAAHTVLSIAAHYALSRIIFNRCHSVFDIPQEQISEAAVDIFLEGIQKRS
jgi:AcrR family transcriptional regulator